MKVSGKMRIKAVDVQHFLVQLELETFMSTLHING